LRSSSWFVFLALSGLIACEGFPVSDDYEAPDDSGAALGTVCDRSDQLLDECTGSTAAGGAVDRSCAGADRCAAECAVQAYGEGRCDALVGNNASYLQCTATCGNVPR